MTIELAEDLTQQTEEKEEKTPIQEGEDITLNKEEDGEPDEEVEEKPITVDDIVAGPKELKKGKDKTPLWAKKRFDELTAEKYELQRKIDKLEKSKGKEIPKDRPIPPVESDFLEPKEYSQARIEYEDDLEVWRENNANIKRQEETKKQELQTSWSKFQKNASRMVGKYDDFETTILDPVFDLFTQDARTEILGSDFGPEIGYFLGKNLDEIRRLSQLPINKLAKEIGKLEVQFSQATKKIKSGAPPPLNPIKGEDQVEKDLSKIKDDDEWYKRYNQEKLKKLRGNQS